MSTSLIWSLGLAGLAVLTVGCVTVHRAGIESDLHSATSAALASAGVAGASPDLSGRDVTLTGTVASGAARTRALAVARRVRGVRLVRDRLQIGSVTATTGAFTGLFNLTEGPGGLVLRGRVPDDTVRTDVIQRVRVAYPGREIADLMTTDPAAGDVRGTLQALLPELGDVTAPDVTIDARGVALRGRAVTAEAKARIEAAVAERLPTGLALRSALAVASGPATDSASAARDQVMPSGDASLAPAEAALGDALARGRIAFDSGTARLTAQSREILDRAAAVFERFPAASAEIRGHTDSEGDARGNRTLSTRRAEATRDYLVQKGVDAARLAPRGSGETEPVASNDTEDGRARNRRVVFTLRQN